MQKSLNSLAGILGGILVGAAGLYLYMYLFVGLEKNPQPSIFSERKIDKLVTERVREVLNQKCAEHAVTQRDKNLDGTPDSRFVYSAKNQLAEVLEDNDFDGVYESETIIDNSQRLWTDIDTNGDKSPDMEIRYENSVRIFEIFKDEETGRPLKVKRFQRGKMIASNVDTDRDGLLDMAYTYDDIEEISASYPLADHPARRIEY